MFLPMKGVAGSVPESSAWKHWMLNEVGNPAVPSLDK